MNGIGDRSYLIEVTGAEGGGEDMVEDHGGYLEPEGPLVNKLQGGSSECF